MSGSPSSGSWSAGRSPPNIIDLDRFIRGAVRPSRPDNRLETHQLRCDRDALIVDAGGPERKTCRPEHAIGLPAGRGAGNNTRVVAACSSDSEALQETPHVKRYSHDSGVSDDSYVKRKHRPQRRGRGSGTSLRVWRSECVRTLQRHQSQLARVAALCEKLSERRRRREDTSSEGSSSSRDTQPCRSNKRQDECETYKIIMTKLDELNRMFVARGVKEPVVAVEAPSSASVSVSDKLVSTEPPGLVERVSHISQATDVRNIGKRVQVLTMEEQDTVRTGRSGAWSSAGRRGGERGSARGDWGDRGGGARGARRAVEQVCTLDIAPSDAMPPRSSQGPPMRHPGATHSPRHVATESVIECNSHTYADDPRTPFDLDDPVRLYAQAKQMQVLTMRRSPLSERSDHAAYFPSEDEGKDASSPRAVRGTSVKGPVTGGPRNQPSSSSWCTLCRHYLHSLTSFCYPSAYN